MKILITGVLGFIGSHCARLLSQDNLVIGLNRISDSKNVNRILDIKNNFRLISLDLTGDISGVLEGIDVVIHFAAKTFVDHSILDPMPFINSNIIGTYKLLEEARRYKLKKFIYISTDEVYGSIEKGYFLETDKFNPTNPYSASKASAEMLCVSYFHTYCTPIIILRCENNYGRWQHPQKAIPTFIRKALNDETLPIYGDGKHRRMWLRVEDYCLAIKFLIENGTIGEVYNVGAKQEYENIQLARMILNLLHKPHDLLQFVPDYNIRPGHDRRYAMDISKLLNLGWKPNYTIENGLPEIVGWYKNNEWWLR